jgi:hypothetical protein
MGAWLTLEGREVMTESFFLVRYQLLHVKRSFFFRNLNLILERIQVEKNHRCCFQCRKGFARLLLKNVMSICMKEKEEFQFL